MPTTHSTTHWTVNTPYMRRRFSSYRQAVRYVETTLNAIADRHPSWRFFYSDSKNDETGSVYRRLWLEDRKGHAHTGAVIIPPVGTKRLPAYK